MADQPIDRPAEAVTNTPHVTLWTGQQFVQYDDTYDGEQSWLKPIQRAVIVARLRTLADLIEGAPQ